MKRNFKQSLILTSILSVGLIPLTASANSILDYHAWHPLLTITGGAAFPYDVGASDLFPNSSALITFNYKSKDQNETKGYGGILLGGEYMVNPSWAWQPGIGYYSPLSLTAKGNVTQGIGVATSTFPYQYDIQVQQLLFDNKILYHYHAAHPYLSLGIGAAFNKANDFSVNVQPPSITLSPVFGSDSTTAFSYEVGFGLDFDVTTSIRLGLGYRFVDFGKVETGNAVLGSTVTNFVLSQSHLYANEVQAQLTYIIM